MPMEVLRSKLHSTREWDRTSVPVFHFRESGYLYTQNWGELGSGSSGYTFEGMQAYIFASGLTGTIPLYRYFTGGPTDNFCTTNWEELGGGSNWYVLKGVNYMH